MIKSVYLFTNRNCLVFDEDGQQMPEFQGGISCYRLNRKKAQIVADKGQEFFLSRYQKWAQPISRREFEYLLGLRSRKRDIAEQASL
jgi:hypothetical protein